MMLRVQRERMNAAFFPSAREYTPPLRPRRPPDGAAARARDRHAPRPDEPRHGDRRRGRRLRRARSSSSRSPTASASGWPCSTCCSAGPSRRRRRPRRRTRMTRVPDHAAPGSSAASRPTCCIDDGVIAEVGAGLTRRRGATAIDADGLVALPGLVDLHTHLREPGREDAETVETGTRAAALGGFTAVHAMANTDPVADTAGVVEQVWRLGREAGLLRRPPGRRGHRRAGGRAARRARRDGRLRRPGAGLLRRRQLRLRRGADAPRAGVRQGLRRRRRPARAGAAAHRGRPDERGRRCPACSACAAGRRSPRRRSSPATCCSPRTSARGCTSATCRRPGSVEIIRWAKARGLERHRRGHAAPPAAHRRAGRDATTRSSRSTRRCAPPTTSRRCATALADGTIDAVATDHAPHPHEDKECEWAAAAFGHARPRDRALGRAARRWSTPACSTGPASPTGCRSAPARDRPARRPRPAARGRASRPTSSLVDPAATRVGRPDELGVAQPQHARTPGASCPARVVATFLRGRPTVARREARSDPA